jgi:hypothetical protein
MRFAEPEESREYRELLKSISNGHEILRGIEDRGQKDPRLRDLLDGLRTKSDHQWLVMKNSLVRKLRSGELISEGFPPGFGLDSPRVIIPPDKWDILSPVLEDSSAIGGGLRIRGVLVRHPHQGHTSTAIAERSGAPGRPTSRHLVEAEFRRRAERGQVKHRLGLEAETLSQWLREQHPKAPKLTKKTIENFLRSEYRRVKPQNPADKAPK